MNNVRKLGTPKTIGELKELITDYSDDISFGFRNQPMQELHEVKYPESTFVSFQENESKKHCTLLNVELEFKKTSLGQAVFVPKGDTDAYNGLFPDKWTISQLRAMANYMEANPNCTLFEDGSGKHCV